MSKEPDRNPRKVLGKGLSALLPRGISPPRPQADKASLVLPEGDTGILGMLQSIPIDQIQTGTDQPREIFQNDRLQELAQSIQANGLIQPIAVYKNSQGKYTIIAGERRWRACRLAGLTHIMALVRDVERHEALGLALVENLQREDLNPVEIARGFERLSSEYRLSHEQIAERTGKDRSTVTNFLRLLRLSPAVLQELAQGAISVGHARALLNITDAESQANVCNDIVRNHLSVRQAEAMVKKLTTEPRPERESSNAETEAPDPNVRAALDEMAMALGTRVRMIAKSEQAGKIEIEYYSPSDLDRIYSVIVKSRP
ncbi:MAG: ParB/RepB/Spo0J family partition protein [Bryobacteraceae bacterium]